MEGLTDTVIALNDSGCQLCAVNAETVRSLDLPVFGQVKLRGISDRHLVPADVVNLYYPKASNRGQIWFIPLRQIMYNVIRRNCDAQHK